MDKSCCSKSTHQQPKQPFALESKYFRLSLSQEWMLSSFPSYLSSKANNVSLIFFLLYPRWRCWKSYLLNHLFPGNNTHAQYEKKTHGISNLNKILFLWIVLFKIYLNFDEKLNSEILSAIKTGQGWNWNKKGELQISLKWEKKRNCYRRSFLKFSLTLFGMERHLFFWHDQENMKTERKAQSSILCYL